MYASIVELSHEFRLAFSAWGLMLKFNSYMADGGDIVNFPYQFPHPIPLSHHAPSHGFPFATTPSTTAKIKPLECDQTKIETDLRWYWDFIKGKWCLCFYQLFDIATEFKLFFYLLWFWGQFKVDWNRFVSMFWLAHKSTTQDAIDLISSLFIFIEIFQNADRFIFICQFFSFFFIFFALVAGYWKWKQLLINGGFYIVAVVKITFWRLFRAHFSKRRQYLEMNPTQLYRFWF